MKRILIAAALCLVSFQSYAESEMTFQEFGDVVYSEDKSVHFMRYTDTTVKKHKLMKGLRYSAGTYGDANGFRDACLAKCAGEKDCGGVVMQYSHSRKVCGDDQTYPNCDVEKFNPRKCLFRTLEPTVKADSGKKKDFYRRICYGGGPGGYSSPDGSGDNETACVMFGKTLVKTASGTIVAPTTCNDGDPYTKANDQACKAAGKTACWDKQFSRKESWSNPPTSFPWLVGEQIGKDKGDDDCARVCAINNTCYGENYFLDPDYKKLKCKLNGTYLAQSGTWMQGLKRYEEIYILGNEWIDMYQDCQ